MDTNRNIIKSKIWYKTLKVLYGILFVYLVFFMWVISIRSIMPHPQIDLQNSFLVCEGESGESLQTLVSESKLFIYDLDYFPDNEDGVTLKKICNGTKYQLDLSKKQVGSWLKYYILILVGVLSLLLIFIILREIFFYILFKINGRHFKITKK